MNGNQRHEVPKRRSEAFNHASKIDITTDDTLLSDIETDNGTAMLNPIMFNTPKQKQDRTSKVRGVKTPSPLVVKSIANSQAT